MTPITAVNFAQCGNGSEDSPRLSRFDVSISNAFSAGRIFREATGLFRTGLDGKPAPFYFLGQRSVEAALPCYTVLPIDALASPSQPKIDAFANHLPAIKNKPRTDWRCGVRDYFISHEERWLSDKPEPGTIVLDDESVWQVSPQHVNRTANWVRFSNVRVECDFGRVVEYAYMLVNTSFGQTVRAKYVGTVADSAKERSA